MKEMEHEDNLQKRAYNQERYAMNHAAKERASERKHEFRTALFPIVGMILTLCLFSISFLPQKLEHKKDIKHLEQMVTEIEALVNEHDYENALIKAQSLVYTANYSSDTKEQWDTRREDLIESIEKAKEEYERSTKLKPPKASIKLEGENCHDIEALFKSAGFTNVRIDASSNKSGWFSKEDDIDYISIDGTTKFKADDLFAPDAEVIIYHFAE